MGKRRLYTVEHLVVLSHSESVPPCGKTCMISGHCLVVRSPCLNDRRFTTWNLRVLVTSTSSISGAVYLLLSRDLTWNSQQCPAVPLRYYQQARMRDIRTCDNLKKANERAAQCLALSLILLLHLLTVAALPPPLIYT